jgi:hypothetical protein
MAEAGGEKVESRRMMRMPTIRFRFRWAVVGFLGSLLVAAVMVASAYAENMTLSDTALDGVSAKGGDISVGSFSFTDNHQYDASQNKGAIIMDGYVQQNVTAEINVVQTQGAAATGLNVISNITNSTGQSMNLNNVNTATSFIGGF